MGQRSQQAANRGQINHPASITEPARKLSVFPTALGWFGLWGAGDRAAGLLIGHLSADEVRAAAQRRFAGQGATNSLREDDWFPALRRELVRYAEGRPIDFDGYEIDWTGLTPFQSRVVAATRAVPYGKTITYGELANEAGSPGAARAAGSVMAGNRLPVIIPCHRIVAAGGKLGGFSAPRGLSLKQQMLAMEAAAMPHASSGQIGAGPTGRQNASRKRKYSASHSL